MNFRELRNRLISSLWDYIGCPVILSNQVQPEAEPPFCIYTVTVRISRTAAWVTMRLPMLPRV